MKTRIAQFDEQLETGPDAEVQKQRDDVATQLEQYMVKEFEQRVAVIGGGPCGLAAAKDLCLWGYAVTVYEALPVAGDRVAA